MKPSFIKLDIDILEDPKIVYILSLSEGDKYFRLWIGLLCLAMKSDRAGVVELGYGVPFTPEILANQFHTELNIIEKALDIFQRFKMIEIWDDRTIFITNFSKHQQLDKIERAKEVSRLSSAKYRIKLKSISDGHVTSRDETDIDKDIDTDQDKDVMREFEIAFWNPYGKKINRFKCLKIWNQLSKEAKEKIKCHVPEYVLSTPNLSFRKNPLTYLNNESWNDEIIYQQPKDHRDIYEDF